MYDYIRYSSPLGMLTVAAENGALTALVIEGQKYADRHLAGEGREGETPVLRRARCWLIRRPLRNGQRRRICCLPC